MTDVVFGYRHVSGVPLCPCRDPGNYLMMEAVSPLKDRLRCWCGATIAVTWDSEEERAEFIQTNGGASA